MTSPPNEHPQGPKPYMTCRDVLDFLMAYIDGELTEQERSEFDRHLAVCASCVNYLESYKAAVRIGNAAMADPEHPATGLVPDALIRAIREARLRQR